MRTSSTRDVPARLEGTCRRFERWRRTRRGQSRIPETLWASAVRAAGKYGLNPTAQALRLDYYALKKRLEAAGSGSISDRGTVALDSTRTLSRPRAAKPRGVSRVATFVELAPPASGSPRECILELEDAGGAKMRVHLKGSEAPDLMALSQSFWSAEVRHRESRRRRT